MSRLLRGLLWGAGGYVLGLIAGLALVYGFSSNSHDISVEAPMTGAFVTA